MNNADNHIITYEEVKEMRKSGNAEGAYSLCLEVKTNSPQTQWVSTMMGWCLYDMLKGMADYDHAESFLQKLQEFADLSLASDNFAVKNICWPIRSFVVSLISKGESCFGLLSRLSAIVMKIQFDTQDENYSIILSAFLKAKTWPNLKALIEWWGLENLSAKDHQPYVTNGGMKVMAVAEQAYIAYAKMLLSEIKNNSFDKDQVDKCIDGLQALVKNHEEMQYPPYFLARLLMELGRNDEAQQALLPFVVKKKNDYWVWDCLGDVVSDADMKLSCYCKALTCRVKDSFLCKLHLKMCDFLKGRGLFDEAKTEIHVAAGIYKTNGWRLPANYMDYFDEPWYRNAQQSENNTQFYKEYTDEAELLVYSNKPQEVILVTNINKEKQMASYVTVERMPGFFSYKKLPKRMMPKLHGIYDCRMDVEDDGYAQVYICNKVADEMPYKDKLFKQATGTLRLIASGAGFVGDIFVPSSLINGMSAGQKVECVAYLNYNKSKQQWGWAAESIKAI